MNKLFKNLKWKIWAWRNRKLGDALSRSDIVLRFIDGIPVYDIKMSMYEPTDIKGLPTYSNPTPSNPTPRSWATLANTIDALSEKERDTLIKHEALHCASAEEFITENSESDDIEDERLGDSIAEEIGDTFIDWRNDPPVEQWISIVKMLRRSGFEIVKKGEGESIMDKKIFAIPESKDTLSEYDLEDVNKLNCKIFVYYYESGDYDGDGFAVWQKQDGTFAYGSLSHCSCYGPTNDLHQDDNASFTLGEIEKISENYDEKAKAVVALLKNMV